MTTDELIAELAAVQQDMVARRQLMERGVSDDEIQYRLDAKRLFSNRWGVYKVGSPAVTEDGMRMGATLVADDACLTHRDGLDLWQIGRRWWKKFEVTSTHRIRRPGIRAYQVELPPDEVTAVRFIPVTGPFRSTLDYASLLTDTPENRRRLNRVLNEIDYRHLTDTVSFVELFDRHPRHKGRKLLETVLENRDTARTENEPEEFVLAWLRGLDGIPEPEVNAWREINGVMRRFDLAWVKEKIGGECDSQGFHTLLDDRENDYVKDLDAFLDDWVVVRITPRMIVSDPSGLERRLRTLFATRGG